MRVFRRGFVVVLWRIKITTCRSHTASRFGSDVCDVSFTFLTLYQRWGDALIFFFGLPSWRGAAVRRPQGVALRPRQAETRIRRMYSLSLSVVSAGLSVCGDASREQIVYFNHSLPGVHRTV